MLMEVDRPLLAAHNAFILRRKLLRVFVIFFIISGVLIVGLLKSGAFSRKTSLKELARRQALEYYSRMNKGEHWRPRGLLTTRPNAVIVTLCRNEDLEELLKTLKNFETRFNKKHGYPYVFLNDKPFNENFRGQVSTFIAKSSGAKVEFGLVPHEHWSYPSWINQTLAAEVRKRMEDDGVIYGGSESYRFMCRYFSGFLHDHPLLLKYDYYWRVEPGVKFTCNIPADPFKLMVQEKKKYGFVITFREVSKTIPSLWRTTADFVNSHYDLINPDNFIDFFEDGNKKFNKCHFWSNFEIASFDFFRSPQYRAWFDYLDQRGGFFYERWGDAPVHTLAAGMFLSTKEIYYFTDIGYHHEPFSHCPVDIQWRRDQDCDCNPFQPRDLTHSECQQRWNELFKTDKF